MQTIEFFLEPDEEYITLVNLLKVLDLVSSGGEVKMLLEEGVILYNNEIEYRKKKKCFAGDVISLDNVEIIINAQK